MKVEDIIRPEQDPSGKLAEFAANLKFEDIPEEHVDFVKKDVLDELACMIAGSSGPSVEDTRVVAQKLGGNGEAKTVVFGDSCTPGMAGLVNGTMARSRDMGDTHNEGGHICEWVIPTLFTRLSYDKTKYTGKDFITAFVAGAEWGAREHVCIHLQFHTNTVPGECAGSRYATGALAKLVGLDKEQIWAAQGIVYSMHPAAEQQKYNEGTSMVRIQHGFLAGDAQTAVELAKLGVEAGKGIYMGLGGLLKNIKHGDVMDPDFIENDLGKRWVWREQITMKPYGGCKYNHTPIYGLLNMMKEHNFTWKDIESVHYTISAGARCTVEPAEVKWNPQTAHEALFSNPYAVAFAAITGDCFIDAFEEDVVHEKMASPEFKELMPRLHYTVDESIKTPFDNYPIVVELKDGRKFEKVENQLLGNMINPMSWEDVEHKFWNCTKYAAVDLGKEKFQKIIDLCKNLDKLDDVHELMDALIP